LMRQQADDKLLKALGPGPYLEVCALMANLERLVEPLGPTLAAEALSSFSTLIALRYTDRRRHG